jgi:thioredoxin
MHEGDAPAGGAAARRLVDEPIAGGAAALQRPVQIRHPVAEMMNARAAAGEEFRDRTRGVARLEQLDVDLAAAQAHDRRPIGFLGVAGGEAQDVAIERQGVGDAGHGDADVGEARSEVVHDGENLTMDSEGANGMTETHPSAVTDDSFGHDVEQQKGLVLVDFWATWCGPCHMVSPILEQLAGEYAGKIKVAKMDVDANQRTTMRFNVRSIPSILFFRDGRHVDTLVGAYPKAAFDEKIQHHLK